MRYTIDLTTILTVALAVSGLAGVAVTIALHLGDHDLLRDVVRGLVIAYSAMAAVLLKLLPRK
jgi:hypothetical protein